MNIYFAHPAFTKEQIEFKKKFVSKFNEAFSNGKHEEAVKLLDPFEFGPTIEGDREAKKQLGGSILLSNHVMIQKSDLVIALIDDRDTGTTYEIGYAIALDKPVITISNQDYEVNIMLANSVLSHLSNISSESSFGNLIQIIKSMIKVNYEI